MIGVKEIAVPVTTSTITTIAAFFPLIFMPGISGEFIKFLPMTLIITLSSSLFVAMLINPVLCSTLMRVKTKKGITPDFDELKLIDKSLILRGYRWLLRGVLKWRFSLLLVFLMLFFGTFYLYGTKTFPRKGIEFFPKTEPEEAVVNITAPMGTTLEVSNRYVQEVEGYLDQDIENLEALVANVGQRRGFGGSSSGSTTTYLSHIVLAFPNWEEWIEKPSVMIKNLRNQLERMVGVEVKLSQAQAGPPTGMPLNIEVRGEDFTKMIKVLFLIGSIPGKRIKN